MSLVTFQTRDWFCEAGRILRELTRTRCQGCHATTEARRFHPGSDLLTGAPNWRQTIRMSADGRDLIRPVGRDLRAGGADADCDCLSLGTSSSTPRDGVTPNVAPVNYGSTSKAQSRVYVHIIPIRCPVSEVAARSATSTRKHIPVSSSIPSQERLRQPPDMSIRIHPNSGHQCLVLIGTCATMCEIDTNIPIWVRCRKARSASKPILSSHCCTSRAEAISIFILHQLSFAFSPNQVSPLRCNRSEPRSQGDREYGTDSIIRACDTG